jgi:site-specific recombinase XerD
MFEQLFGYPKVHARHRAGPLAEERSRYVAHLAEQGVPRFTLRYCCWYLLAAAKGLRLAERPQQEMIPYAEVGRQGVRWMKRTRKGHKGKCAEATRNRFVRHVAGWLSFLGRLQPRPQAPRPFAEAVAAFADYRCRELGLARVTIRADCSTLQTFLDRLGAKVAALPEVTVAHLDQVFLEHANQSAYARTTLSRLASVLRVFFRYGERQGWCRPGLATAIKAPCIYAQESLPAGPSWDQVQHVLATTEGDRPADIRDRAILMVLAVYGARAVEVRQLRLEDLDWERELLTVTRSKTRRTQVFPLARPVAQAILRYLTEVRPRSPHREVFLTLGAPHRPLCANLWRLVAPRLHALGVSLPHYGPHALRHACATHLLARGLSMKEIGDHLGHQDTESTRVYAKVDLVGLRQVADFDLGGVL